MGLTLLPVLTSRSPRKESPVSLQQGLIDLAIVSLLAALTPIVAGLLSRLRVPQVVILIVGGILVGPEVLGWADPDSIELIANVGLGFLFLLAGYELELGLFRERAGRLAVTSWLVTAVIAVAVTGALAAVGFVQAFVPIAIGLTTTALGTLLPILRDNQMLEGRFGAFIMAAGAVGEFLPIVAIAIFLSANGAFLGLISLVRHRRDRAAVHVRPAAGAPREVQEDHRRGRARDVADHPALDHLPALRAARDRRGLRARRGARGLPGRRGAAPMGAGRRRTPSRPSSTRSATASSSRSSSCRRA